MFSLLHSLSELGLCFYPTQSWLGFVTLSQYIYRQELLGTPRDGGNGKDIDWQKIAGKKGSVDAESSIPSAQKIAVSELLEKVKGKTKIKQLPVQDDDDDEEEIDTKSKSYVFCSVNEAFSILLFHPHMKREGKKIIIETKLKILILIKSIVLLSLKKKLRFFMIIF